MVEKRVRVGSRRHLVRMTTFGLPSQGSSGWNQLSRRRRVFTRSHWEGRLNLGLGALVIVVVTNVIFLSFVWQGNNEVIAQTFFLTSKCDKVVAIQYNT